MNSEIKYWVVVTRYLPHEQGYSLGQEWFSDLNEAIKHAKKKDEEHPDDAVTIEVGGWRE